MLKRVSALCALGFALGAVLLQAQDDVFVLPGAGSNVGLVEAFNASPLSQITTFTGGNGSFLVLPTLNAATYYVIADSTAQTITSTSSLFTAPVTVADLPVAPSAAVITPDGKVLALAAGSLYLFNTTTNTAIVPGGFSQGSGVSTFGVAASLDATTLYALGSTGTGTSQLTAFNLATSSASASVAFPSVATAVAVGPNGLVYVSLPNEILELDPRTLNVTAGGTISVIGTPGGLVFTASGQYAVAINKASLATNTLFIVTLATHTVSTPSLGIPLLSGLVSSGMNTVTGFSGQNIYQITTSATPSVAPPLQIPSFGILALTASNEVPAQNLFAVTTGTVYRINPATTSIVSQFALDNTVSAGTLSFAAPALAAAGTRVASLLTYGTNQSILPGASSEPLLVRVLDSDNQPIMGVPVQFQSSSASAPLSATSVVTEANGYALTYLTAPSTAGPITVTATVSGVTPANFNIAVSNTAGGTNSPTLSIVSGQGQILGTNTNTALGPTFGTPLEVVVTDANGNPIPDVAVTFTVPAAYGSVLANGGGGPTVTVNTAADGTAEVNFETTSLPTNTNAGFDQTTVTVTTPVTNSVVFYVTTVPENLGANVYLVAPNPGQEFTGTAGSTLATGVSVQVLASSNDPIPNVALILNDVGNPNPADSATAFCSGNGGVALSNASGVATCDIAFGPHPGMGSFTYSVGFTRSSLFSFPFTVSAGAAAVVEITQGNNQVGNPGQTLPVDLAVLVTDSGGNPVVNAPVTWQVLTAGAVTLANESTTTTSTGNAYAQATLGNIGGVAQVKVTVGGVSATFNFTVNIPSAGIQKVSGDLQSIKINTEFPLPLTVEVVNSGGGGVEGAQVNFQVTSGTATLSSTSVLTGSNGQASTAVTAGGVPGAVTVSASSSSFNVVFTLTVLPIGPTNITIVNGASFSKNTGISPGGIATISGSGFLTNVTGLVTANNIVGPLPLTLGGVSITFGAAATPAPIYYVQSVNGIDQVTVQVPFEVQPGSSVPLTVSVTNGGSATVMVPVKAYAPGVFTTVYDGKPYAVVVRPDGSYVSPTNPAQLGENISVYVTGLGEVAPAAATGDAGVPGQSVTTRLIVGLNNGGVPLISADYAPGLVGVYVVTLQVPEKTKTGPYQPIGVRAVDSAGHFYFDNATFIPIQ
jgi:adhesin/invasin